MALHSMRMYWPGVSSARVASTQFSAHAWRCVHGVVRGAWGVHGECMESAWCILKVFHSKQISHTSWFHSLLITHSLLTTHYLLPTTYCLLLTTHHLLLTAYYSLTTHYSLLTTHYYSLLTTYYSPLTTFHY